MSPAGRPLNSGTASLAKNHANTVTAQSSEQRRLRSNNNNASGPLRHTNRRSSTSNTPTKPSAIKSNSKSNDISQRIITILESVPSTISVSEHPSNSLPTNFASLRTDESSSRRNSHHDESDDEFNPDDMVERRTNGPSGIKPSSSFKRPGHGLKRGPKKHVGGRRDNRQHLLPHSTTNGMPPPHQVPSKMHFRARAIDPQRQMPIQVVRQTKKSENNLELEMLCNNKVLKRPLFNVPSGKDVTKGNLFVE